MRSSVPESQQESLLHEQTDVLYFFPPKIRERTVSLFLVLYFYFSLHRFNKREKGCELNVLSHSNDDRIVLSKRLNW